MIFGLSVFIALIVGLIQKGSLKNLGTIRFKYSFLVLLSIGLQILIFNPYWDNHVGSGALTTNLYALALLLIYAFLLFNMKLPGMILIALGTLSNGIAIFANQGHMPASLSAYSQAFPERVNELVDQQVYYNSVIINEQTRLPYLCDIFWVPHWFPLANVFSIGDVLLCIGAFILIRKTMLKKG